MAQTVSSDTAGGAGVNSRPMREFILAWEFWIPPLLAMVAIGCIVWLFSHNQDLLRQKQIDEAALTSTQHLDAKIERLQGVVQKLQQDVSDNSRAIEAKR